MNNILKKEICLYLGELMHEQENKFDWIFKNKIEEKIKVINILLDLPTKTEKQI